MKRLMMIIAIAVAANFAAFGVHSPSVRRAHQPYRPTLFSKTDCSDGTVRFSETKSLEVVLDFIGGPLGLVFLFESSMDELDQVVSTVAEIQHRLNPVK